MILAPAVAEKNTNSAVCIELGLNLIAPILSRITQTSEVIALSGMDKWCTKLKGSK